MELRTHLVLRFVVRRIDIEEDRMPAPLVVPSLDVAKDHAQRIFARGPITLYNQIELHRDKEALRYRVIENSAAPALPRQHSVRLHFHAIRRRRVTVSISMLRAFGVAGLLFSGTFIFRASFVLFYLRLL
jgi:hypothetical protein